MANQKSVFVPARGWRGKRCEIKKKLLEDGKDGGRGGGSWMGCSREHGCSRRGSKKTNEPNSSAAICKDKYLKTNSIIFEIKEINSYMNRYFLSLFL